MLTAKDSGSYGKPAAKLTSNFLVKMKHFVICSQSKNIVDEHDRLRQLILIEEFKGCVPENTKIYIEERKVDTVYEMSTLSDEYAITHKRKIQRCLQA